MTKVSNFHPLTYIAEALEQMATTLRDFEMEEAAKLIDEAKVNIDRKLGQQPKRGNEPKQ
jgi:hypothetical protein